jgi:chemotaxis protein MotB
LEKRRHAEEEHENEERWLLTYADLITLLMAFFVIMYALSRVDAEKFKQLSVTLSAAFHTPRTSPVPLPGVGGKKGTEPTNQVKDPARTEKPEPTPLQKLGMQLQELVKKEGLEGAVTISTGPGGHKLLMRLSDSLLFDAGQASLTGEAQDLVGKIATIIAKAGKQVRVEGHSDNIPIHTAQYESNWQLSTARASNVVLYLIEKHDLPPEMLSASGYGEYRPIAPNDTPENRGKNRRVEFVITDEDRDE